MIDYLNKLDIISKRHNERIRGIESRKQANKSIKIEMYKSEIKRDLLHSFSGGDLIVSFNSMPIGSRIILESKMPIYGDYLKIRKTNANEYFVDCKLSRCTKINERVNVVELCDFFEKVHDRYFKHTEKYFEVIENLKYTI